MLRRSCLGISSSRIRWFRLATTVWGEEHRQQLQDLERRADDIYKKLLPYDFFSLVPKDRASLPMVLLLGNHSSGKSSLINYLLGQREQETGVAPTDDGFTVITRGDAHADQDGPSLMSDSRWAFSELKQLGPTFLNHFRLKSRVLSEASLLPAECMIVDSPGMIDTPLKQEQQRRDNRGYDFLKAVRWFAERSDVILLLFDPNNPGTTGETLDVLTESLADLDHKFLLILNKVDQFKQVHDFARAYGSLCWNLAKVIRRKDIPRIYTMFTPTAITSPGQKSPSLPNVPPSQAIMSVADVHLNELKQREDHQIVMNMSIPLSDFNRTRDEVVAEILRAPQRRVDNIVTTLEETINRIRIACAVSSEIRAGFRRKQVAYWSCIATSSIIGPIAVGSCVYLSLPVYASAASCSFAALTMGSLTYMSYNNLQQHKSNVMNSLDSIFNRLYYKQIDSDSDLVARWERIKPKIVQALQHLDIHRMPKVRSSTLNYLDRLIDQDIRQIRTSIRNLREINMIPDHLKNNN